MSELMKYYRKGALLPAVLLLTGYICYAIIYVAFNLGKSYKSEWMTANAFLLPTIILIGVHGFIVCILSLGIFLHGFESVKNNRIFSLTSWFILPFSWHLFLIIRVLPLDLHAVVLTLPFVFALVLQFIQYHKDLIRE